jgi:hypothetical protein
MATARLMTIMELCFAPVGKRPAARPGGAGRLRADRQFWLFLVRSAKARQVLALRLSTGPCLSLVSRTRTASGTEPASTQSPPLLPL